MQQRLALMFVTLSAGPTEIAVRPQTSAVARPRKRTWDEIVVRRMWVAKAKEVLQQTPEAARWHRDAGQSR